MSYKLMYGAAIAVAVAGAMLVAVQAAGPEKLGISEVAANWLSVINAGLIVLAGILPSVRTPPNEAREGMD